MPWVIELLERDDRNIDPHQILKRMEPEARSGRWAILDLDGVTKPNSAAEPIRDLQDQIQATPYGLDVTWERIVELVEGMEDIWDALFVARRNSHPPLQREALLLPLVRTGRLEPIRTS